MSLALAIGFAFLASRRVFAQEVCTSDQESSARSQLGTACGSSFPSCLCNYRTEDQSLSQDICTDYMSYCSGLDATSCGTQRSWTNRYDDGTVTYGYDWAYKLGQWRGTRLVSIRNYDQVSCSFQIIDDNAGTSFDCACEARTCSAENSEVWYIDCTGYSTGAYADGCLGATWGITSGVLEGLAIPWGLCNDGSNNDDIMSAADDSPPVKQSRGGVETSTGKIVGIVIGALVVVVGFGVGVWHHRKHPENLASFVTSFFHGLMLVSGNRQVPNSTPINPPSAKGNEELTEPSDSGGAFVSSDSGVPSTAPEVEHTESLSSGRHTTEPSVSIRTVTYPNGTKARITSKSYLDAGGNRVEEEVTEVLDP
jgi:hypothetical protein